MQNINMIMSTAEQTHKLEDNIVSVEKIISDFAK